MLIALFFFITSLCWQHRKLEQENICLSISFLSANYFSLIFKIRVICSLIIIIIIILKRVCWQSWAFLKPNLKKHNQKKKFVSAAVMARLSEMVNLEVGSFYHSGEFWQVCVVSAVTSLLSFCMCALHCVTAVMSWLAQNRGTQTAGQALRLLLNPKYSRFSF